MLRPPRTMILEDALKKRLPGYCYSEDYYFSQSGYNGEKLFTDLFPIQNLHLELHNLFFNDNNSSFEVDRIIITGDNVYSFDVKNYSGEHNDYGHHWQSKYRKFKSPLTQFEIMKRGMADLLSYTNVPHQSISKMAFVQKTFDVNSNNDILMFQEISKLMSIINKEKPCTNIEHHLFEFFKDVSKPTSVA